MVLKEWNCQKCVRDFCSIVAVCPYCGAAAKRTFLTPVGINKGSSHNGSAKRIDKALEREFQKQGIANFSNSGGENKVRWARRVNAFAPGRYNTHRLPAGAPGQLPIQAYCGAPGDFSALERADGYGFRREAFIEPLPFSGASPTPAEMIRTVDQGGIGPAVNMVEHARATALPPALARRTERLRRLR